MVNRVSAIAQQKIPSRNFLPGGMYGDGPGSTIEQLRPGILVGNGGEPVVVCVCLPVLVLVRVRVRVCAGRL